MRHSPLQIMLTIAAGIYILEAAYLWIQQPSGDNSYLSVLQTGLLFGILAFLHVIRAEIKASSHGASSLSESEYY